MLLHVLCCYWLTWVVQIRGHVSDMDIFIIYAYFVCYTACSVVSLVQFYSHYIRQPALVGTPPLRTGGFCWSEGLLPACPCWQQLVHSDWGEDAGVLLHCLRTWSVLHPFNGLFSRKTWISRYHKGKTSLDLYDSRDDGVLGWWWHQVDHMQTICTSLQADKHTNTSSVTGRVLFPATSQQCQSTEGHLPILIMMSTYLLKFVGVVK